MSGVQSIETMYYIRNNIVRDQKTCEIHNFWIIFILTTIFVDDMSGIITDSKVRTFHNHYIFWCFNHSYQCIIDKIKIKTDSHKSLKQY